ncbi:SURF1 family protein [Aquiluna sp. KACHI24]|uniref:SURF1 family protein n=1 Tax=Aquiluna sp. KACHI24 TaxID=2968831 RepID=UPI00220ED0BA|nr:SURF1 family protein [Aquiluna sp. KACHI24]BDP99876.1 hypothetical protein AKACHI_02130 [Aquiluna sp. KACHI24]
MNPSFWQVAKRPKWLLALLAAVTIAAIFALLMQWQLERTFRVVGVEVSDAPAKPLDEMIQPGPITKNVFDQLATVEAVIDPENAYVVANRLQLLGEQQLPGYWVVSNSLVGERSLTLALGFTTSLEKAKSVAQSLKAEAVTITGYVEPTEPPRESIDGVLQSLSLAQLINLYSSEEFESYPAYLIVQEGIDVGLEKITIGIRQQEVEINWLTAFYAVEWAFFALAAFYIWWRLVRDEQLRIIEEG